MQVPINWALVSDSFFSYLLTGNGVFIVNFEHISHHVLVFLLLTLNM